MLPGCQTRAMVRNDELADHLEPPLSAAPSRRIGSRRSLRRDRPSRPRDRARRTRAGLAGPRLTRSSLPNAPAWTWCRVRTSTTRRLVSPPGEQPRIEFNPHRRAARVRFSVAHELGHLLFSDHGSQTRYRAESHTEHARSDDWQLEVLCNVAAAEILMPAGAFPYAQADDLSLPHLLGLRTEFGVSTEALLRRVIKLTERATCLFAATRLPDGGFRIDYTVSSRAFDQRLPEGQTLDSETALAHCTAVGFSVDSIEHWPGIEGAVRVQAVGVPPYPGHRFPRVVGLLQPEAEADRRVQGVRIVGGDATRPIREGPTIIAHIVNDTAQRWGGHGFANALGRRMRAAREDYAAWAGDSAHRQLGAVHVTHVDEGLWVASMVAQVGYGASRRSRLRLPALRDCFEALADDAKPGMRPCTCHR